MFDRPVCRYVFAVGISIASTLLLLPFGAHVHAPLLLLPVLVATYFGRLGPGLVALGATTIGGTLLVASPTTLESIALFVTGLATVACVEALHRSRARERASRVDSEHAVEHLTKVFTDSAAAMSVSRLDTGIVVDVNSAYLRLFGIAREQILDRTPSAAGIVSSADRDALFGLLRLGKTLDNHEYRVVTPGGAKTCMLWSRVIVLDGIDHALTTFLDITQHKAAEDAARVSDERFRELAESIEEVFWLTDANNERMLYVSPAYETLWGRSCDALYADARNWLTAVHPDDRERMATFTRSGATEPSQDQYRIIRPDGTVRTIHIRVFPVRDAAGNVVRIAGLGRDITEQVGLEEQVRQAQKLESLGLLAGGVAHDFNNILAVVAANASLLGESQQLDEFGRELVGDLESAVQRATGLTRQLLAFSRKQVVEPTVIDLNRTVTETRKMLRRMVGEDIVIETSLDPEAGHPLIDPGYLVQVIMNLAVNARDAMPRGGALAITTRNRTRNGKQQVVLAIADTGCGMPPEVQARVFEPFFTTKGVGKGTGLGLSVVHGIVRQANGEIEIESTVGVGTMIRVVLPVVSNEAPAEVVIPVAVTHGTERVVVVDDDVFVRRATSRALRSHGYDVLEAGDGPSALRLLEHHGDDVALLITDVVMPAMDGRQLVDAARNKRPSLRVLYMSGYTDDAILRHGVQVAIIEKPFRGHSLATRVRQVLDASV